MELYQLAYFVEIARQQNFTRAAQRLHVAQAAISQQMQKLEAELGTPLFVRGKKQTLLTPAGEAFYPRAQSILGMAEAARHTIAEMALLKPARLVIATIPTISAAWLPLCIQQFRIASPEVELVLREESSHGVARLVELAEAEIGFLQLPVNGEKFQMRTLVREPFFVVVPSIHALAAKTKLKLEELAREPFILYKGRVREVVLSSCRASGFEPRIACETGELETVKGLVRAGLGISLLPRSALPIGDEEISAIPLAAPKLSRALAMITRRDYPLSNAAKAFWKACSKIGKPQHKASKVSIPRN